MKPFPLLRALPLLIAALLLGGCASYDTQVVEAKGLKGVSRFFVVSNLNDNHAIDRRIAETLKSLGFTADAGPRTMMPDDAQAVVTYQDRWAWDFGDHLMYLVVNVRDGLSNAPLSAVTFSASIPLREPADVTVSRVVARLFPPAKS